jgi:hypothetical protein
MNDLLSGLGNSRNNASCNTKQCGCGGGGLGGFGGNNSIIWIILLLCFCCGGLGQGQGRGTVCGCKKKHCKELCRCGSNNYGGFGLGSGFGSGCGSGFGSGFGCWWIIILVLLFTCNGNKQNRGCTNNIINLDNCDGDEE